MVYYLSYVWNIYILYIYANGLPRGSAVNNPSANAGDMGSFHGSGRSSGEENGNPLQYSCLVNPMDRGAWWAPVHEVAKELDIATKRQTNIC